jgi:hypothetical protein
VIKLVESFFLSSSFFFFFFFLIHQEAKEDDVRELNVVGKNIQYALEDAAL